MPRSGRYGAFKRGLDLGLTVLSAPIVLPLLAASAVAIRVDTPGPILFRQDRMGKDGRLFRMVKLRTMVRNAEALKWSALDGHSVHFKTLDDPRITRVGRVLRKTSLDELPQLWNVLRGEMSLVGPRPTSVGLATYDPWHTERLEVRPGLTGPWQVHGRNASTFDERVRLDLRYVRGMSLREDIVLLVKTVLVVFKGTGA